MELLALTTVFAFALALPPLLPRDEWQPADPTQNPPPGAPVPTLSTSASLDPASSTATAAEAASGTTFQPADDQTCIYLTNALNWVGEGFNLCNPSGQCAPKLPDGLSAKVLSAGPSPNQVCFLYGNEQCLGTQSQPLIYPGYADLGEIGFGNVAKSWMCWEMTGLRVSDGTQPTETALEIVPLTVTESSVEQQTTPGGLPVSTPVIDTTDSEVQPTNASSSFDDTVATDIPTATSETDTDIPSSAATSETDTDVPSSIPEPTTDDGASESDTSTTDESLLAPTATPVATTVTHTYADGETVVTTL